MYLLPTRGHAQIVNIEDKRKRLDSLGWYGQLDLGGNVTKNTNTVVSLSGALRLDRPYAKGAWLILADYRLVQVSGANALNAGFGHLRHGRDLGPGWRWETFTQVQYNEQLRLNLRYLAGTGLRLRLLRGDKQRAYLGLLYMFEYDELSKRDIIYRDHRLSNYLSLALQLAPRLGLNNTTYYQPRLPDLDLARVSSVTSLTVGLTEKLSLNSRYAITLDARVSRDIPEVPKTTYSWVNGLRWTF